MGCILLQKVSISRYFLVNSVNILCLLYILYIVFIESSFYHRLDQSKRNMPWPAACNCEQHGAWFSDKSLAKDDLHMAS